MAKKAPKKDCEEMPAWLITFSDMMTLMLTFFVLLVSMSRVDENRKLVVLGSIIGTFGWDDQSFSNLTRSDTKKTVEPGPIESTGDLEPLKPLLWEDVQNDLNFQSNRFVQVLSINADVLFESGSETLSQQGQDLLGRIAPVLAQVQYPLLLAGHTSTLRDEMGEDYRPEDDNRNPDLSWRISLLRTLSVYKFLVEQGVPSDDLKLEAFGKFAPHYTTETAEGRKLNRRVDIVLDKRSLTQQDELQLLAPKDEPKDENTIDVDGFKFNVNPEDDRPGG